jgi:hypothetical protein
MIAAEIGDKDDPTGNTDKVRDLCTNRREWREELGGLAISVDEKESRFIFSGQELAQLGWVKNPRWSSMGRLALSVPYAESVLNVLSRAVVIVIENFE